MTPPRKTNFHFVMTLMIFAVAVYFLYRDEVLSGLLAPLTTLTVDTTYLLLNGLRVEASREASVIFHPDGFAYEIYYRCTGILPVATYAVAVVAYPAFWRQKLLGLVVGVPLLFALNLTRLVHLFIIGVNTPEIFDFAHAYIWRGFMVLGVLGSWLVWEKWAQAKIAHWTSVDHQQWGEPFDVNRVW